MNKITLSIFFSFLSKRECSLKPVKITFRAQLFESRQALLNLRLNLNPAFFFFAIFRSSNHQLVDKKKLKMLFKLSKSEFKSRTNPGLS